MYNITNPLAFFQNGEDAIIHEIGPYSITETRRNRNVVFEDDIMEFVSFSSFHFNPDKSCPWCQDLHQKIYTVHLGYNTLLAVGARSEAVLLLTQACSPMQIGLISSTNVNVPFCTAAQQQTSAACRCCFSGAPVPGAVSCASLTAPTSPAAGRMSWLAKYDGGLKLSSTLNPKGFVLAPGVYTPISRETTPSEILFGTGSPLIGFLGFSAGSEFQKEDTANVTRAIGSVCGPLYCPSLQDMLDTLSIMSQTEGYTYLTSIQCEGLIPDYVELMTALGISEESALKLRYLEGVNCRGYTPTLVIAALAINNSWAHNCYLNGETAPCCLSTLLGPETFKGSGFGCMFWLPGTLSRRRVFNAEDALVFVNQPHARSTNCASEKADRLVVHKENGRTEFNRWYTPSTYAYPNMPW